MTKRNYVSTLRRQLLKNGYTPLPNVDKACYLKGWPKVHPDENMLKKWGRMRGTIGTGIRVENGLCVIDIDIDHPIIEDVIEAMLSVLPEECQPDRLERAGKGHKLAWFVQTADLFARLHTRRWTEEGATNDDGTHCIEIFGGASPRQFGSFGPHTYEDGKAKISYVWAEESPADVPLNALPLLTKTQLFEMLDAAEAEMQLQGFNPVKRTTRGEGSAGRVYDLTSDMVFEMDEGGTWTFDELSERVKTGYNGRCSASWLEGPTAQNTKRCLVSASGSGHVSIWESAEGVTHMPASIKPVDHTERIGRIAKNLREYADRRCPQLTAEDDHVTGAAKLLVSHAWIPTNTRAPIMPLRATSEEVALSLKNFRVSMAPYCGTEIGPRGGEKKINPVDVWLANPNRILAAGVRMRPDQERPVYEEDGAVWVNTYQPPNLGSAKSGDIDGGVALLKQLLPDKTEREWFRQWLAYKWKNPHVPGPGIIMVARDFGTGRGTFGRLIKRLFGQQYVVDVPFKIFAGLASQSQYTDWGLDALFAIVNESSASGEVSSYKSKKDVYEHLKEVVDPSPTDRLFIRKGEGAVRAMSSASCMIMTNNIDALPLPEDDRRFAVLSNGGKRSEGFWRDIYTWMDKSSNISAFADWLNDTNIDGYSPYDVPLMTNAKRDMSDTNNSLLDNVLQEAIDEMQGFFVAEQVIQKMLASGRVREFPRNWHAIVERELKLKTYRYRDGDQRLVKPMFSGKRFDVFHVSKVEAKTVYSAPQLKAMILKNGDIFNVTQKRKKIEIFARENAKSHLKLVEDKADD